MKMDLYHHSPKTAENKLGAILFIALLILVTCIGCSKTYYGKHITVKVKDEPTDEFQADGYIVLAFENSKYIGAEGWQWEFWTYYNEVQVGTYRFQARIVGGNRSYYLVEEIVGARPETVARFSAKPNYDRVKERLTAHLAEKGAQEL